MRPDGHPSTETELPPLSGQVLVIDSDQDELMALIVALNRLRFRVSAVEPKLPLKAAAQLVKRQPAAIVVALGEIYNLVDIRELLDHAGQTRCVFLLRQVPPRAALVRVASQYGAAILSTQEAPLVLAATLVAMLAQGPHSDL